MENQIHAEHVLCSRPVETCVINKEEK
jgi:hypothetical protein